jgi:hypothetical protein
MDLLGNVGQMEAHLGPFRDIVNLHTRLVHYAKRAIGRTRWIYLVL